MKVNIEISDWEAQPHQLRLTVNFPQLSPWLRATFYRRRGQFELANTWGWYANGTDGGLPDNQEDLDAILSTMVDAHPTLHSMVQCYDLDGSAYVVPV